MVCEVVSIIYVKYIYNVVHEKLLSNVMFCSVTDTLHIKYHRKGFVFPKMKVHSIIALMVNNYIHIVKYPCLGPQIT